MSKYKAGDRAMFGGKVCTLEEAAGSRGAVWSDKPLQAREEATGRLMGKVRGEWQLEPVETIKAPATLKIDGKAVDLSASGSFTSIAAIGPKGQTHSTFQLDPKDMEVMSEQLRYMQELYYKPQAFRLRDFVPVSVGYSDQIGDLVKREIGRVTAGLEMAEPPRVHVREVRGGQIQVDLEIKTLGTVDAYAMEKTLQHSIARKLDQLLLAGPGEFSGLDYLPPSAYQWPIKAEPTYAMAWPQTPAKPSHTCDRCNGPAKPAYVGFFEGTPKQCTRYGGCLADRQPDVKAEPRRIIPRMIRGVLPPMSEDRSEILFVARGGGLSVRHPLQDEAVAIWREISLDRAFGRTPRRAALACVVA